MSGTTEDELITGNTTNVSILQNICLFRLIVHTLFIWFIGSILLQVNAWSKSKVIANWRQF